MGWSNWVLAWLITRSWGFESLPRNKTNTMLTIDINGTNYNVCDAWGDITIERADRLLKLRLPDGLRDVYNVAFNPGGMTPEEHEQKVAEVTERMSFDDQYHNVPKYMFRVVELLSDIPVDVLKKVDVMSVRTLYHSYLRKFVEGVNYQPTDYEPPSIEHFDFEGVRYYLPTSKNILGVNVPCIDMTALEFAESTDLMSQLARADGEKDFTRYANVISIMCRPDGEPYDEGLALARAERFKGLTMDVVWSVFFSLIRPFVILNQLEQTYFLLDLMEENGGGALKN